MTTANVDSRDELRKLMQQLGPTDLTDDEIRAMLEPLRIAWERRQEPIQPGVVYLDFVHSAPRSRR